MKKKWWEKLLIYSILIYILNTFIAANARMLQFFIKLSLLDILWRSNELTKHNMTVLQIKQG